MWGPAEGGTSAQRALTSQVKTDNFQTKSPSGVKGASPLPGCGGGAPAVFNPEQETRNPQRY